MEFTKGLHGQFFGRKISGTKSAGMRPKPASRARTSSFLGGNRTSLVTKSEEFVSFRKVLENGQHRKKGRTEERRGGENLSGWLLLLLDM